MVTFLQTVVTGLGLGSLYLLLSIGLLLIFSVLKVANFAHGEFLMVPAYLVLIGVSGYGLGLGWAFLIALLGAVALGLVVYFVVVGPSLRRPAVTQLVATFAAAVFLQNGVQLLLGAEIRSIQLRYPTLDIGGVAVYLPTVAAIVTSLTVVGLLFLAIKHTEFGIVTRAVAQDRAAAEVAGIRTERVCAAVFVLGAVLAAVGGLFMALTYPLHPHIGAEFTLKAFAVVVLAGMGNVGAAALTSMLLGVGESMTAVYIGSRAVNALTYGVLVLTLIARPTGIVRGQAG